MDHWSQKRSPHAVKDQDEQGAFDPFTSRRARDLRNALSHSLMRALDSANPGLYESAVLDLLARHETPVHRSYARDRLRRYRDAYSGIRSLGLDDPFAQALVLWDHGLFFEAHERWETVWQRSSGERREALKGLILAAGVWMQGEQGRVSAAKRLAAKARALLERHGHVLPIDATELLRALDDGRLQAPKLVAR